VSKDHHIPASAAHGIGRAIAMLEGRWKLVILFHLFGGKTLRFSDLERAIDGVICSAHETRCARQLCQTFSCTAFTDGIYKSLRIARMPPSAA